VEENSVVCAAFDSMGMMLGGDPSDPVLVIPAVNVMIEREAGTQRVEDIRQAAGLAAHHLGGLG
jgi:ribosomal protein L16/L10AE